jgi:hypothetical protein
MVAPDAWIRNARVRGANQRGRPEARYQNAHQGHDKIDGAMGPDHDHVPIGDAGVVQIPCQRVGSLVDLAVGKTPLWRGGRLGLDDTGALGMGLGLGAEVLLDRADVARPVEVDSGIR